MGEDEFSMLTVLWLAELQSYEPRVCSVAPSSSRKQPDVIWRNKGREESNWKLYPLESCIKKGRVDELP